MAKPNNFASRLNTVLDDHDFPEDQFDRECTFSEFFNIPTTKAKMILSGSVVPKKQIIENICDELFIDSDLLGSTN